MRPLQLKIAGIYTWQKEEIMCAVAANLFNKFKDVGFAELQASLMATLFSKVHLSDDHITREDLGEYATKLEFDANKSDMAHYQENLEMRLGHKFDQVFHKIDDVQLELKNEIAQTRAELKTEIAQTRCEMTQSHAELKTEIAQTRCEMMQSHTELKTEIAQTRCEMMQGHTELKTEISQLRVDFTNKFSEVHTEIGSVRCEISKMRSDLIQWIAGLGFTMVSLMSLFKIFG